MDQCLHLLVVDPREDFILIDWHRGRWLLPVFGSRERVRVGPLAQRLADRRGIGGHVVGQWLGRVSTSPDVVDWVVVVRASVASVHPGSSTWISPRALLAADPVIEYQRWALEKMLAGRRGLRVRGPFGHPEWPDAVHAWVASTAGTVTTRQIVPYRMTAHAIVMMLPTSIGPLYVKGLSSADEAALTIALSSLAPASFPRTHAVERGLHGETWWLMHACAGSTLSSDPTVERARLVARECGRLQRDLPAAVLDRLVPVDAARAAAWSAERLQSLGTDSEVDRCVDLIQTACADVAHARTPVAWTPLDLDPGNVILEDGQVRFIDIDESYRGPAPLAVATFVRRLRRLSSGAVAAGSEQSIYAAAEQGLGMSPLGGRLWRAFEIVSMVLEMESGWRQVLKNIERNELHAPLELIERRIAQRLLRAVAGKQAQLV